MNKKIDNIDIQAAQEGIAVGKAFRPKTQGFGKRLKKTYRLDGDVFLTGQKHRAIGRNY